MPGQASYGSFVIKSGDKCNQAAACTNMIDIDTTYRY